MAERTCSVEGCDKAYDIRRGWCGMHYRRWRRNGDPLIVHKIRVSGTPEERFWAKVHVMHPFGCWWWTAYVAKNGYGLFKINNEPCHTRYVHRYAYELLVGPIPEGLELDHLCRNRACVNPDHLEPVTKAENIRRGYAGMNLVSAARRARSA